MNNEAQYKYQPKCRKPHSEDMEPPSLTVYCSVFIKAIKQVPHTQSNKYIGTTSKTPIKTKSRKSCNNK